MQRLQRTPIEVAAWGPACTNTTTSQGLSAPPERTEEVLTRPGGSHPGLVVMVAKGRSPVEDPGPTSDGDERAVRLEQRAL
jgi:hypothetical protein